MFLLCVIDGKESVCTAAVVKRSPSTAKMMQKNIPYPAPASVNVAIRLYLSALTSQVLIKVLTNTPHQASCWPCLQQNSRISPRPHCRDLTDRLSITSSCYFIAPLLREIESRTSYLVLTMEKKLFAFLAMPNYHHLREDYNINTQ